MDKSSARAAAVTRLAIGLAQGIVLFLLQKADESKAWPATAPMLYAPLLVCVLMVPLIPLSALSAMRRSALIAWSAVAAALVALTTTTPDAVTSIAWPASSRSVPRTRVHSSSPEQPSCLLT